MSTSPTVPVGTSRRRHTGAAASVAIALAAGLSLGAVPSAFASESHDDVLNAAHRGSSDAHPENTLTAFRAGAEQGADLIEIDVQRSADGELVVIHDTTLARTTNVEELFPDRAPWNVGDFTAAEMQTLDAGSWKGSQFAGEKLPTFTEAIDVIRHSGAGMLLEIKAPELYTGIEADVSADLRESRGYVQSSVARDKLMVQSFNFDSMKTFTQLEPTVPVGLLGTPAISQLPDLATWADQINPHHLSIDAAYVTEVQRLGMDILVWTVNTEADMTRAIDLGVDGVITNRPDVLDALLDD
ncbi:glycerophosphodiester phosphodiesterase [Cryobacterium roopkundense]|uniref:Glycerophosphoryl diester phosphodiesterase n=1 Tax=Cryobacterium roopkundense TaxID=1001240 RepID=A0A7W9E4F4_9MICO|nr:glycerophosphodiester phosphodiesterase family protein [Cryobacterium roopkundense]MBB5642173.1 glycerophosphoryl diester phosphodiesterase [Cryobacterium roopkundense]